MCGTASSQYGLAASCARIGRRIVGVHTIFTRGLYARVLRADGGAPALKEDAMNRRQTIAAFVTALVIGAALGTALPAIARSVGITLPSDSSSCSVESGSAACTADCNASASSAAGATSATGASVAGTCSPDSCSPAVGTPSAPTTATCTDGTCGSAAAAPATTKAAPGTGGCTDCQ